MEYAENIEELLEEERMGHVVEARRLCSEPGCAGYLSRFNHCGNCGMHDSSEPLAPEGGWPSPSTKRPASRSQPPAAAVPPAPVAVVGGITVWHEAKECPGECPIHGASARTDRKRIRR